MKTYFLWNMHKIEKMQKVQEIPEEKQNYRYQSIKTNNSPALGVTKKQVLDVLHRESRKLVRNEMAILGKRKADNG